MISSAVQRKPRSPWWLFDSVCYSWDPISTLDTNPSCSNCGLSLKPNLSGLMASENNLTSHDQVEGIGGDAEKAKCPAEGKDQNGDGDGPWIQQLSNICAGDGQWIEDRLASPMVSIYKVPATIRSIKKEAFDPQVVPFGPISRGKDEQLCPTDHYKLDAVKRTLHLSPLDHYKLHAVKRTLNRVNLKIVDLLKEVKSFQMEIRNCYEDRAIEWDEDSLVWILTMDACFILEFFRSHHENNDEFSLVFNNANNALVIDILMDILKLENQIPLRIIKRILELEGKIVAAYLGRLLESFNLFKGFPFSKTLSCAEHIEGACHLLDVCCKVVTGYLADGNRPQSWASDTGSRGQCSSSRRADVNCGSCIVGIRLSADRDTNQKSDSVKPQNVPAEKLKNAGIKLEAGKGRVAFEDNTFSLHSIIVDDATEIVLRNLMAFEECQKCKRLANRTTISDYINIMENLIDSEADVALLTEKQIIRRFTGGDKEIVDMFDTLCKGISTSRENPFRTELDRVGIRYNDKLKTWESQLKEKYRSQPWLVVSLLIGTLLSLLSAVNTVHAILKN